MLMSSSLVLFGLTTGDHAHAVLLLMTVYFFTGKQYHVVAKPFVYVRDVLLGNSVRYLLFMYSNILDILHSPNGPDHYEKHDFLENSMP